MKYRETTILMLLIIGAMNITTHATTSNNIKRLNNEIPFTNKYNADSSIANKKKIILGIAIENTIHFYPQDPDISLNGKADYGIHSFYLGIITSPKNIFSGFKFTYKLYPNASTNLFNLYFIIESSYTKQTIQENGTWIDTNYNKYPATSIDKFKYFGNYFGYGFDVKLAEKLFLTHCIGIGLEWKAREDIRNVPDFPSASYNYKYSLFERSYDIGLMIKIGIGFNLTRK